jgi:hypothetical protein
VKRGHHPFRFPKRKEQTSFVEYLRRNGFSAKQVHDQLKSTIGPEAIGYSIVTTSLRGTKLVLSTQRHHAEPNDEEDHGINERTTIRFSAAATLVQSSASNSSPSTSHQITWLRSSPSLIGPTFSDTPSVVNKNRRFARRIGSSREGDHQLLE